MNLHSNFFRATAQLIANALVPPAELESVLLQHAEIADAAVIGIESKEEATELPR